MSNLPQQFGLLRSLAIYYGIPWRQGQLRRFYCQFIRPGDLCFDIGAHVGNQLRAWSALGARIVAVEPQPQCMRVLRRWYGRQSQITLIEQAVGARPGTATLYISQRTPTVSTLSPDWQAAVRHDPGFLQVRWDSRLETPVTTLDELIARHGPPAFCKIDVEGYELEVLQGLSQALPALSFEYLAAALAVARAGIDRLEALGRYEYNWSPGERRRLQSPNWLSAYQMLAALPAAARQGASGDIYARLQSGQGTDHTRHQENGQPCCR